MAEIRAAINPNLVAAGRSPKDWEGKAGEPSGNRTFIAGLTTVRPPHFTEIRDALREVLSNLGLQFTRGEIVAGGPRTISKQDPLDLQGWVGDHERTNGVAARAYFRYDSYSGGQTWLYGKGRRTEMWDPSGHTVWRYDERGRAIEEHRYIDGKVYSTYWGYDAMDRVTSMAYPDGEVVSYGYNAQLLLASMSGSVVGAIASDITYNPLDRPKDVKLPNAVSDLYLRYRYYVLDYGTYPYGALWDIRLQRGSDLLRLEHGYDNVRNVTRVIDSASGDFTYEYDALDRLLKRKITGGADQEWFTYSQIGNILTKNGAPYSYGSKPHAVTDDGSQPYEYDPNGNMTRRGSLYLKYDAENRVAKVSSDAGGAQYVARLAYDGNARRAKRLDTYGTIHYVGPHYERNVGNGADTTEIVTKYYYAQMGKMKRLVAFRRGSSLYYVVPDHLGGTVRVVEPDGDMVDDIRYHAFGATRSGGTNLQTDKRFTGQVLDLSTGLYWYESRAYDSVLGRFVQPDTIVPDYKDPQSLNRFSYVRNNPTKYTDPTGNSPWYPDQEGEGGEFDESPELGDDSEFGGPPDGDGLPPEKSLALPSVITATGVIGGRTVTSPFVAGGDGTPSGTWGIGVGGTAGIGGGVSGSFMLVGDFRGNLGIAVSGEGGGYGGVGAGGGLVLQVTNAPTIDSLAGPVTRTGGSYTFGPGAGPNLGVEAVIQEGVMGTNVTIGVAGGTPVELHGVAGNTWLIRLP